MHLKANFQRGLFSFFLFLVFFSKLCSSEPIPAEFFINLKDPEFSNGVIRTEKGGIITAQGLKVQAQNLEYTHKTIEGKEIEQLVASGDLMMDYKGRTFVGEKLTFDFVSKTGTLTQGKTSIESWYLGGDTIFLCKDGSFRICGGSVTTCLSQDPLWKISAAFAEINQKSILSAKNVRFQFFHVPLFWVPAFKSNLKIFKDPPVRFRVLWDKTLGPRLSMRYRVYSTETLNTFLRFDYRILRGPGGALESEYFSKDARTSFVTKNYGALDKAVPNEKGNVRYRFQGILKHKSEDQKTALHAQWDKLSDDRIISDFKSSDFELNTEKLTYLSCTQIEENAFGTLTFRPRINRFDSLNQELPLTTFGIHPFELGKTGILSENYATAGYLDYVFVNQLDDILKPRRAARVQTTNSLYRPFSLKGLSLTPQVGLVGIYYTSSPLHQKTSQLVYTYGLDANIGFFKHFLKYEHFIKAYCNYLGYSRPEAPVDTYYIFDINDGYSTLNQLRFGLSQRFLSKKNSFFFPNVRLDLYGYGFFGARSFSQTVPKLFADLELSQSTCSLQGGLGWNLQEHLLDYANALFLYTVSEKIAFGVEMRHRSRYDWRKADHSNFTVDFARELSDLLESPLSDKRNTLLTKMHIRFSPRWSMHIQTHSGWGRSSEPSYNGVKAELYTMLPGNWQLRFIYEYAPNDPFRFSYNFKLVK